MTTRAVLHSQPAPPPPPAVLWLPPGITVCAASEAEAAAAVAPGYALRGTMTALRLDDVIDSHIQVRARGGGAACTCHTEDGDALVPCPG